MNATDLASAAAVLETCGVRLYRPTSGDGGANIKSYEPVTWVTALTKLVTVTGWAIGPDIEDEPESRAPLRLVREGETE